MAYVGYAGLIFAGFIPSFLWLFFYLRKDMHPEPKRLILEVFFFGILLAPLAILAQWLLADFLRNLIPNFQFESSSGFFIISAFIEEIIKFLAIYYIVIHNSEFDEPVDAMIYMVTAALGFAAIENIIVLFKNMDLGTDGCVYGLQAMWCILGFRAVGATLLHTISSALLGYFLALSWFFHQHSRKFIWIGITVATVSHSAFNIMVLQLAFFKGLITTFAFLIIMLFMVSILFNKVQQRSPSKLVEV